VAKFENPVIKELLERYRRVWSLGHAMSLMGWDEETYMPSQGVVERATAMAELRTLYQELITSDQFVSLVERASKQEGLNEYERGVVRVLNREITILKKIPPEPQLRADQDVPGGLHSLEGGQGQVRLPDVQALP